MRRRHLSDVSFDIHLGGKMNTTVAAPRPAAEVGSLGGRTIRTLLFLFAAIPVGAVALAVLIAGWIVVAVLAITPLVVPALMGFRAAVGGLACFDAGLANALLGTATRPDVTSSGPTGFWRRTGNVLGDGAFWRQQSYLLLRLSAGFAVAVFEWTLLASSLGALALPIWYRWSAAGSTPFPRVGSWHVDTLGRAFLGVPVGVAGLAVALGLTKPLASASRGLVEGLLRGADVPQDSPAARRRNRLQALALHTLAYALVNALMILIWGLTSRGYFWPEWTLIALGLPLAVHAWVVLVDDRPEVARALRMPRELTVHAGLSVVFAIFFVLVWAVTGAGYFWPVWTLLGLGILFLLHTALAISERGRSRIARLEETRAGAVDQRDAELARIERDLHDGAQARLVALGMSLGMAEQKLDSDPGAAQELLAEARRGTQEALQELRSLVRDIHPPVLVDRGLEPAIAALVERTPLRIGLAVDVPDRPPRAVETAAYFVVTESLANAGKHARAERIDVALRRDGDRLVVEVVDDGRGGADPGGSGLRGLARRVEALDGRVEVVSPAGGPTMIRAVIPCGS
jgi:signal transduction histidine kinase